MVQIILSIAVLVMCGFGGQDLANGKIVTACLFFGAALVQVAYIIDWSFNRGAKQREKIITMLCMLNYHITQIDHTLSRRK